MKREERYAGRRAGRAVQAGAAAALCLALLGTPFPALADDEEDDRLPIESISLCIESSIEVRDSSTDVEVTSDSSEYEVDGVEIKNEPDQWDDKDEPKLEITLEADSDYYFPSGIRKGDISLSGSEGKVTSVRRRGDEELRVTVRLEELEATDDDYDLEVSDAEWDQMNGMAEWNGGGDAHHYRVRLYRNDRLIETVSTTGESCNLGKYFTQGGTYTFLVRAVYNGDWEGGWEMSDDFDVTDEQAAQIRTAANYVVTGVGPASGNWEMDALGFRYRNADQTYTVNNWQQIGGLWYYFDENGYRKTGWILWQDRWYFLDVNGVMLANAFTPDGKYVGADGAMLY